jgi:hypothetical protein
MPPIDQFPARSALSSARDFFAITPAQADLSQVPRAIWVGGAGDLQVVGTTGASPIVLKAVPAGTLLPISPTQVMSTLTTATSIVGLV